MTATTKEPKFYDTKGQLTSYALACGYCEKLENGENRKTLYKEHCTFHVISFINGVRVWDSFDTLAQARKAYNKIKL